MALNAETIAALAQELSDKLTDGRIEKIQQPEKDLLLLTIRSSGTNYRLLIRASGPNARAHLTKRSFENPAEAPMFCMLLRKYLGAARIRSVEQPNGDRILLFSCESRNELGDRTDLRLVAELMGRAANVVLVDAEGRILDCLRRIPLSDHGGRALLPGLRYELPELPDSYCQKQENAAQPTTYEPGVSEVLDERYGLLEQQELQRRRAQELLKSVRRARDRQQRKLAVQREELQRTENMERLRRNAELLQANLYRVKKGDRRLECEDYFEEDYPLVEIELDPLKTPQQNLTARYKAYKKARGAKEHLNVLISEGEKQLDYLNSVIDELMRAESERELHEIRQELELTGWIKKSRKSNGRKQKSRTAEPLRYVSPDGLTVLVGRNNVQNDELTTKLARRTDYWLHVRNMHGSHVILCCEGETPSPAALQYAAELAAEHSEAKGSGHVAVDYTMVRNVKKPSGTLPGKVFYQEYKTVIVESE
ncbi:MAG: NFACT family protein [Oscillospiraceae bacterium]|nr:NFACT family protein [Oscillospiraceae bacterium]